MQRLDQELNQYRQSDFYPFHMPGHKRRELPFPSPFGIDITEIGGFDNLHHASGILKDAQQRAAELYGSDRCFYLVNGSTCGILAAVCASASKRDKVLVARNCHKAVYHALYIHELHAEYLYPRLAPNDLQGHISPAQVEAALKSNPDAAAVILTSPAYEGIISDIGNIARAAHARGIPLIVDEAHGAHLGFGAGFAENAVRLGADAVIMSLHKTLPSFTQTALLHLNTGLVDADAVEEYLDIFETSSPSYLLMAGMDACICMLREHGPELFSQYRERLSSFYHSVSDLKKLHVMTQADLLKADCFGWDDSKLVIFTGETGLSGQELLCILREKYHLEMEMASGNYVLGMTSFMDEPEGFLRLSSALHETDRYFCTGSAGGKAVLPDRGYGDGFIRCMYGKNQREMQIYQARSFPSKEVPFSEAEGKMSAGYISLYPPGIPLIVPGEIISAGFLKKLKECRAMGLTVEGLPDSSSERIRIVYF